MKQQVLLSICGRQSYLDQEPDVIELVTEGTLEDRDGGWELTYEESELTGLKGVTTTFRAEPGKIVLSRKGPLTSQMVFQEGFHHESLYQMEFGTLMITVCATKVTYDIDHEGGTIDLTYAIEVEHSAAGVIDYHLDIRKK
ncbi:MAG: DUF1934 domain-containing protein [Oscillospiraceae bacterium]|nr:DUF1934 domain-containing protein [Oscillospiraceae bacterium]